MNMWGRLGRPAARDVRSAWTGNGGTARGKITVPSMDAGAGDASAARRRRLKPKIPKDKFATLATAFLDRVEMAMAPLAPPVNEEFAIERRADAGLTIRTPDATFEVLVVPTKQRINLTTPVSGRRVYEWNARTQRWEDENDSHDVEGLLTRDVMRFCIGIPLF